MGVRLVSDALTAEEFLLLLVNTGEDCPHPPRYRTSIPGAQVLGLTV